MTEDEVRYESKSIHVIRGLEAKSIAKWEKEGWELTGQTPALVRTEITFRRVKPKQPLWVWAVAAGAILLIVGGFITLGVLEGGSEGSNEVAVLASSPKADASSPEPAPSVTPTPTFSATSEATPSAPPKTAKSSSISEIYAAQFLAMQWESKFTYGGKVHWIMDRITTANPDGTFTFKLGATVKNAYGSELNATIEGDVGGTDATPTIIDSILYTADGEVVNFNG